MIIHHMIRAVILFGFAMFIVYLDWTGEMILYIAPRMELYVKLSALGLYAAAVYQLFSALQLRLGRTIVCTDCDHTPSPSIFKNIIIYGMFITPLLLGFLMPTGMLGSALASKKGVSLTGSPSIDRSKLPMIADQPQTKAKNLAKLFPYDIYTKELAEYGKSLYDHDLISIPEVSFIETITTLDLYRKAFLGKEVELSGFVFREDDLSNEQMIISRFAMNCCSADSLPYGLLVEWPKASSYAEDEWLKVKGRLTTVIFRDNEILMLKLNRVERIEKPENPYVYPDLQFGS